MQQKVLIFLFLLHAHAALGQATKKSILITRSAVFNPLQVDTFWVSSVKEAPKVGGTSYHSFLNIQKKKQKALQRKLKASESTSTQQLPVLEWGFDVLRPYISHLDTAYPVVGDGQPLDNTLAVSNDGILLTAVNSKIYAHDLNADTSMFKGFGISSNTFTFGQFSSMHNGNGTFSPFDPKLLYDSNHDRFIFTFISGRDSADSKMVVGFSSTNNPLDEWYLYDIPGNPRMQNQWSDYPAIALSQSDLFYTINIIIDGVSWQEGFDGSLVWQMGLDSAYAGAENVQITMWDSIMYNDKFIRNLQPVSGAMGPQDEGLYFISNRNFDLQNDSVFVVHINGAVDDASATLSSWVLQTNQPYGMPLNGQQQDTDSSDATSGLQTNDARWLGAIKINNEVQFVGNTINQQGDKAAVYHGVISDVTDTNSMVQGTILSDDVLDFGYPNIAFSGKNLDDKQVLIGLNYSSVNDFAGVGAFYANQAGYSDLLRMRDGDDYIDAPPLQNDGYERWGDYFGIQPIYNSFGKVFMAGMFGLPNNRSGIYLARVSTPDSIPVSTLEPVDAFAGKVFPNPFQDDYLVKLYADHSMRVNIKLYDLKGQLVYMKQNVALNQGKNNLNFSSKAFNASIYHLVVEDENAQVLFSEKLFKK